MNVLKPFDVDITSNEDAIRDLEDYNPLEDIVTGEGYEVVRSDYDVVNALVPGYSFEKIVGESRIKFSEKRVSYLDLSHMSLDNLSGEIGKLDGLEKLYLAVNILSVLPDEIGNLVELRRLYLGYNSLSVLPVELCGLPNLGYLNVTHNSLSDYSVVDKLKEKGVEVLR